jgi:sulfur-oxidizing protein SoxA
MRKLIIAIAALSVLGGASAPAVAKTDPASDLNHFRQYFYKKFPGVKLQEFSDGIYAIDQVRRYEWEAMEEFPPYEAGVDKGKALFAKYNLGSCFKNGGKGIKQHYPYFDSKSGSVRTLEGDLMACLKRKNVDLKAEKLRFGKGNFAAISAYMAYTSRGQKQNVVIPNDKRALAIYEEGKHHFYAKRGQLNMACADCHVYNSGMMARGNLLSPALGHTSHFPVWRRKWAKKSGSDVGGFGTIQRRYSGCNKQVRALPLDKYKTGNYKTGTQHPEYVALEYFHTYMSNGIRLNGPSVRQ